MIKLVRSELLKVRTTNIWWIFAILLVGFTGLSILGNILSISVESSRSPGGAIPSGQLHDLAASMYTSGQYFGLLFVLILGVLVVTNEFFHQTATTTFLTTPRRTSVITAKLVGALLIGLVFWLVATVLSVLVGVIYLSAKGYGTQLDVGSVWRAIALNLLGYMIWTVVGIGVGALIRAQIAAVIVGIVGYFVTGTVAEGVAFLLSQALHWHWAPKVLVVLPGMASSVMINGGGDLPGSPARWLGGVILVGWGVVAGLIGTALTRTRDIT